MTNKSNFMFFIVFIAKHIHTDQTEHTVELDNTEILTTEPRWFERGVKEPFLSEHWTLASTGMVEGKEESAGREAEEKGGGGGLVTIVTHNVP